MIILVPICSRYQGVPGRRHLIHSLIRARAEWVWPPKSFLLVPALESRDAALRCCAIVNSNIVYTAILGFFSWRNAIYFPLLQLESLLNLLINYFAMLLHFMQYIWTQRYVQKRERTVRDWGRNFGGRACPVFTVASEFLQCPATPYWMTVPSVSFELLLCPVIQLTLWLYAVLLLRLWSTLLWVWTASHGDISQSRDWVVRAHRFAAVSRCAVLFFDCTECLLSLSRFLLCPAV